MSDRITRRGFLGLLAGAAAALVAAPLAILAREPRPELPPCLLPDVQPGIAQMDYWEHHRDALRYRRPVSIDVEFPREVTLTLDESVGVGHLRVTAGDQVHDCVLQRGWQNVQFAINRDTWHGEWLRKPANEREEELRAYWFSTYVHFLPTEKDLG